MNRTESPKKQAVPFGVNGQREDLLATTPAGDNAASYDAGFPPVTMILKAAGGLPPKGRNMNQILFELSSLARWSSAGALNTFDSTFSTSIGGYPKGAVLLNDDGTNIFISTVEANTNNPNSSSTGWLSLLAFIGAAPLASPTFTGDPKAPTPAAGDNDTSIATTAFVVNALASLTGYLKSANNLSDLASVATARTNLGLGTAALLNSGLSSGDLLLAGSLSASLSDTYSILRIPVITSSGARTLVIQMGYITTIATSGDTSYVLTFPSAFQNSFLYGTWTPHAGFTSQNIGAYVVTTSVTGMTLTIDKDGASSATIGARWLAIGY